MPMSRYQIRNEYSLSDPELYRAADKDDPEALLEGVAMAGFVGVLRQLGDLAEFAAEIFHVLHEEVMMTAARGHDLMIRVQELEAEVPSIERTLLFQTDHSSFFYNPGVDWHPIFREDTNLVASGDLPRFILNSYEECRGPPQLFLLDKYDIGGAGACLKRYTDPAIFKVETSVSDSVDGLQNNKSRKAKKRGPRLSNEDATEALLRPNPKLHQLFLEEPIVKGVNKSARAKLKRRLNGFPFDTKSGKSYMEDLFVTPPEHDMHHEVNRSSPLWSPRNGHHDSDPKLLEVRSVSPVRISVNRIRHRPHPDEAGTLQNQLLHGKNDVPTDIGVIRTTLDEESIETDIYVDGEREYGSSSIIMPPDSASEIGNHSDATSARELELQTNSELRLKNDWASTFLERQLVSAANSEHFNSQQSLSHATAESEEGSTATSNERSSIISPFMQNTRDESSKDASSLEIIDKGISVDKMLEPPVFDNKYLIDKDMYNAELPNSEEDSHRAQLKGYVSDETASALRYREKESDGIFDSLALPRTKSFLTPLQVGSSLFSPMGCMLKQSDSVNLPSTSFSEDTSASASSHNYDVEVLKPMKSSISSSNISDSIRQSITESERITHSSDMVGGKLGDEIQECSVTIPGKYTERGYDDNSTREKQGNELEAENLKAVSDSPNRIPFIMEASSGKDPMQSYPRNIEILESEDNCSSSAHDEQIDSEKSFISVNEDLHNAPDTHDSQETYAVPGADLFGSSLFGGVDKSWSSEETYDNLTNDFVVMDKPCMRNSVDDTTGSPVILENDKFESDRGHSGLEVNNISGLAGIGILNDVHGSDDSESETGQKMSSSVPEISGFLMVENDFLPVRPAEFVGNSIPRFADSRLDVSEETNTSCGDQAGTSLSEGKNKGTAATSDVDSVVRNSSCLVEATWSVPSQQNILLDTGWNPVRANEGSVTLESSRPPHQLEGKFHALGLGGSYLQTSVLENQPNLGNDVSEYPIDSSKFTPSLPKENQIALNDTPPLPPLPPFKWRMGKPQHFSTARTELPGNDSPLSFGSSLPIPPGDAVVEDMKSFNPSVPDAIPKENAEQQSSVLETSLSPTKVYIPPEIDRKEQHLSNMDEEEEVVKQKILLPTEITIPDRPSSATCLSEDMNHSPTPNVSNISSKEESIKRTSIEATLIPAIYPTPERDGKEQKDSLVAVTKAVNHEESPSSSVAEAVNHEEPLSSDARYFVESSSSYHLSDTTCKEENAEQSSSVEADSQLPHTECPVLQSSATANEPADKNESHSPNISLPSGSGDARPLEQVNATQLLPETTTKEEKPEQRSSVVEADLIHVHPQSEMESKKPKLFSPVSEGDNGTALEEGVANEIPKPKLPRPHNPLIDAISALDKSKLRKVVQNDRAQVLKANERESFLEQIKSKSFNLKPAMGPRPRVEPPRTNLKVAAILEKKANAIRQAFAGSDDDDEDEWSDT